MDFCCETVRREPGVFHRLEKPSIGCHWSAIDGVKVKKKPNDIYVEDSRYAKYVDGRGVFQKLSNFQSFFFV